TVTISSDTSGFEYIALLRNSTGQTISTFTGSNAQPILATLPQGNQSYDFEVRPLIVGTQGNIQITVGLVAVSDTADAPDATAEATVTPPDSTGEVDDSNACIATNTGDTSINIR